MHFNPKPKQKRIKLKSTAYTKFRREVFKLAGGVCKTCGNYAPLNVNGMFIPEICGHVSHKRHGSNKEDKIDAVDWECFECHSKRNEPKWSAKT